LVPIILFLGIILLIRHFRSYEDKERDMKKRCLLSSLFVLGAFTLTASALAVDVPLKYVKFADGATGFIPPGQTSFRLTLQPPTGGWTLPKSTAEKPLYGLVRIGSAERLVVFDRQKSKDKYYNRVYFDANANRDLTDDPVVDGKEEMDSQGRYCRVKFGGVETTIEAEGKRLHYSVRPELLLTNLLQYAESNLDQKNLPRYVSCAVRTNCVYAGEFKLDGRTYSLMLADTNGNGSFNDAFEMRKFPLSRRSSVSAQGDSFYIDGDGNLDAIDRMVYGNWLLIGDKLFRISGSPAKAKMILAPVTENLFPLKLAMLPERLSISMEDGKDCIMMFRPAETIMIPPGRYRLFNYELFREDEQGDLWRLCANATTDTPYFTAGQSVRPLLEFGEPYAPVITTATRLQAITVQSQGQTKRLPPRVPLVFNVEGMGREFVNDLSHIRGSKTKIPLSQKKNLGHRPAEPTYEITKVDGEVVTTGFFEYG
jgi:hypothetical protein